MSTTLLTERAVVLASVQTAAGVPVTTLSTVTDAVLATNPDYSISPNVLERKFSRKDLSPFPFLIGRKLAMLKFETEVRGNGKENSGIITDAPILARLLRGCGYALSVMSPVSANAGVVAADSANPLTNPIITWAIGGVASGSDTQPVLYTMTVGAAGAEVTTDNNSLIDPLSAHASGTMTSGTALTLGASGVTVTPTFAGTIAPGSVFRLLVLPTGMKLSPISDNQEVLTLECYFDGLKHRLTDAMGTFTINAQAGGYATMEFTFTGQYVPTIDTPLPDVTYETTLPEQVELANLTWGSNNTLVVEAFTFDQKNTITPRPDVNGSDGYRGVRLTSRAPEGTINPEATLTATEDFWGEFASAASKHFVMQVGTAPGNIVVFEGTHVQTSDLSYGDRSGIRAYSQKLSFSRINGNDEFFIYLV